MTRRNSHTSSGQFDFLYLPPPVPRTVPSDIFQAKAMLEVLIISNISSFAFATRFCASWAGLMFLLSTQRLHMEQQGLHGIIMIPDQYKDDVDEVIPMVTIVDTRLWKRTRPAMGSALDNLWCCETTMLRR